MVTRGTYFDDDEQIARRYSSRGHGYSLGLDRDLPPTPHHVPYTRHHVSSHNGNVQNNRQSPEQGTSSAPRRRIPVAVRWALLIMIENQTDGLFFNSVDVAANARSAAVEIQAMESRVTIVRRLEMKLASS